MSQWFSTKRHICWFVVICTVVAIAASQLMISMLLHQYGIFFFRQENIAFVGLLLPICVGTPLFVMMGIIGYKLNQAQTALRSLADTDPLTGLLNRRCFFDSVEQEFKHAEPTQPAALFLFDADYFKSVNDTYGHAVGDQALQFLAEQFLHNLRGSDLVCRLGGEEFALVAPCTSEDDALKLGQRIIDRISTQPLCTEGAIIELSVSCGVALFPSAEGSDLEALLRLADEALYQAKSTGRNKLCAINANSQALTNPWVLV